VTAILIIMAGLTCATVATLLAALHDRKIVREAKRDGIDLYLVRSDIRSESFRLGKHVLSVAGIAAMTSWGIRFLLDRGIDPIDFRNGILIAISVLLSLNSLADLWSRHYSSHAPTIFKK
jgi:hypothetical protein